MPQEIKGSLLPSPSPSPSQATGLSRWLSGPRMRRATAQIAELSAELERAHAQAEQFARTSELTRTQLAQTREDLSGLKAELAAAETRERRQNEKAERLNLMLQQKAASEAEMTALRTKCAQLSKQAEYFREAQESSESRAKSIEQQLQQAPSAASKYRETINDLEVAKSAVVQLQKRNKRLQQRNSALEGVVSRLGRLEDEAKVSKALVEEAQDKEARLKEELEKYRSKLTECNSERQRLRGELASMGTGSLIDDLYDLVPYSCWVGTEQQVATNVASALKRSGRFQSLSFHSFDHQSRNCYFVCRGKPRGNQIPQVLLIGFNFRRRKIWASVHESGHSL